MPEPDAGHVLNYTLIRRCRPHPIAAAGAIPLRHDALPDPNNPRILEMLGNGIPIENQQADLRIAKKETRVSPASKRSSTSVAFA